MVALLVVHLHYAFESQVVGFGSATREDDFLGIRMDQLGDLFAGGFHTLLSLPSERVVAAGGVPELLYEIGQH